MALNGRTFFRHFIDEVTKTVTYIVGDRRSGAAVVIDPVKEGVEEYSKCLDAHDLTLHYVIDTHVHTEHITGAYDLVLRHGGRICISEEAIEHEEAHEYLKDGQQILLGTEHKLTVLSTPGHSKDSISILLDEDAVFTGDSLWLDGCGYAFDPEAMFDSVTQRLLTLPPKCYVFPGHSYTGMLCRRMSLVKKVNPTINDETSKEDFVVAMRERPLLECPGQMNLNMAANFFSGK